MLCPTCQVPAPGGSVCPTCHAPIPEQETFEGQGGHYLRVFVLLSLILFVLATTVAAPAAPAPPAAFTPWFSWAWAGIQMDIMYSYRYLAF